MVMMEASHASFAASYGKAYIFCLSSKGRLQGASASELLGPLMEKN
jgi:hypothetical protein